MHYTAVIEINKVQEEQAEELDQYGKIKKHKVPKKVTETTKMVLRASTLDALKTKITAHTTLIEEN